MAVNTRLEVSLETQLTDTVDLGTKQSVTTVLRKLNMAHGNGAGQNDRIFKDTRTIAASDTDDLDLVGTALTDPFGNAFSVARIKLLYVAASAANTNSVVVGDDAAPWITLLGTSGTVTLRPGAFMLVAAGKADATGYGTTATTADILQIANSGAGTSVTYDIVILGCNT